MLKIDIVKKTHMHNDGAQALRIIQNVNTPHLDLLVREAIQNSLDAGRFKNDVYVDFSIKEFYPEKLNNNFEHINHTLNSKYGNNKQKLIVISDKNTEGLTGGFDYSVDKLGNLLKLVYNIGKPQDQKGAGGSWGYGKTIYYRLGIGIVIYYSRIKTSDNNYEERLVASLVEDQNAKETIIKYENDNKTGIAWFGALNEEGHSIPVTDENIINEVLSSINIERYKNDETGTRIIIPYIDEYKLMAEANSYVLENEVALYDDIVEYLTFAIQKWYAPRLNNDQYIYGKQNNLIVSVNNEIITDDDFHELFLIIREMYKTSFTNNFKKLNELAPNSEFFIEKINVNLGADNKYLSNVNIGTFVYGNVYYKDLGMGQPTDLTNPYRIVAYQNYVHDDSKNFPIIVYTRQPGMIINYADDNVWSKKNISSPKDTYIIGFFVLNSSEDSYIRTNNGNLTYEEYFRNYEEADHMNWYDSTITLENREPKNLNFVGRITRNINEKLRAKYSIKEKSKTTNISENIAAVLGNKIMPKFGYGNKATQESTNRSKTSKNRSNKKFDYKIIYEQTKFINQNNVSIPFVIDINSITSVKLTFNLYVQNENNKWTIAKFQKETNSDAPFYIENISFDNFKYSKIIRTQSKSRLSFINNYVTQDKISGYINIYYREQLFSPIIEIDVKDGENDE